MYLQEGTVGKTAGKLRVTIACESTPESFIEHQCNLKREEGFWELEPLFEITVNLDDLKSHKDDLEENLAALLDELKYSGNFDSIDTTEFDTKLKMRLNVYDHKKAAERINAWLKELGIFQESKAKLEVRALQI
ncbi:MAG: hypothetical protein KIT34_00505 [Cyanobacteria bacterium TGS_CYA1]|nr:hypothetical protein [Cyanobacteria bacterium TGS_CYA1]